MASAAQASNGGAGVAEPDRQFGFGHAVLGQDRQGGNHISLRRVVPVVVVLQQHGRHRIRLRGASTSDAADRLADVAIARALAMGPRLMRFDEPKPKRPCA